MSGTWLAVLAVCLLARDATFPLAAATSRLQPITQALNPRDVRGDVEAQEATGGHKQALSGRILAGAGSVSPRGFFDPPVQPSPSPSHKPSPLPSPKAAAASPSRGNVPISATHVPATSKLWGMLGESYTPRGTLTDVAFAGYMQGNQPIPEPPVTKDLKADFGAVGNGVTDDTDAWDRALAGTPDGGVLYVPPGTYKLIRASQVYGKAIIIRGAGLNRTTLYYPNSFADLYPDNYTQATANNGNSPFHSGPYLLTFQAKYSKWMTADDGKHKLADITAPAQRGDYYVTVSSTSRMKAGQWVQVLAFDRDLQLINYLYGNPPTMDASLLRNWNEPGIRHLTTIREVVNSTCIRITRPLSHDLRAAWVNMMVIAWNVEPLQNAGIENLSVRFRGTNYPGHLKERGFNWLQIYNHRNCFVRNLRVTNADFGMDINGDFCTVQNITLDTDYDRASWNLQRSGGLSGHHGIALDRARGTVVQDFEVNTKFVHDVTLFTLSTDNVIKRGRGIDLSIDYHEQPMTGNLWQQLDCGACTRLFIMSSGAPGYGLHSGMYNTFWNIYSSSGARFVQCLPVNDFGINLNFAGLGCDGVVTTSRPWNPIGWSIETIDPQSLWPQDLHQAMRDANLNPL